MTVHITLALIFMVCIMIFKLINNKSIINIILDLAGYTYGPLLGLFAFGILTKRRLNDSIIVTIICLIAPVICYFLSRYSADLFAGYRIGIELLLINGLITFAGLYMVSQKSPLPTN